MLDAQRGALSKVGVAVVLRSDMERGVMDMRRLHRFNRYNPVSMIKVRQLSSQIKRSADRTIVISEENIMGTMPGVLSPDFYPYFPRLVEGMTALAGKITPEWSLCPRLVVRRQDHYIESVYAFRVSRGLKLGFNDFLMTIDIASLSWLSLLKQLVAIDGLCDVKITALEAWAGTSARTDAANFLALPSMNVGVSERLRGNRRYGENMLAAMLACNRVSIESGLLRDNALPDTANADAFVEYFGDKISARQRAALLDALSHTPTIGFSEAERASFLANFAGDNKRFLDHDMVVADNFVWD